MTLRAVSGAPSVAALTASLGTPNFSVGLTTASTAASANIALKVPFNNIDWDSGGFWNAGLFRFLPTIAGTYQISLTVYANGATVIGCNPMIYLNGAEWRRSGDGAATPVAYTVTALAKLNGTTDYIEGWARMNGTTLSILGSPLPNPVTWMQGLRIGP
jgi:hypothetical protein